MSLKFLYLGKKLHTYIALDRYDVCTMSRDVGRSEILGGGASYNVGWKILGAGSKDGAKMGGGGGGRAPLLHPASDIPDERNRGAGISEILLGDTPMCWT